jgi:hypothetical protein
VQIRRAGVSGTRRGREAKPENLIGDRAYDSDPLDEELRKDGIEMIAPHRGNRSKPPTQDRRRLSPSGQIEHSSQNVENLSQNRLKGMTRQASWTKPRKLWA